MTPSRVTSVSLNAITEIATARLSCGHEREYHVTQATSIKSEVICDACHERAMQSLRSVG